MIAVIHRKASLLAVSDNDPLMWLLEGPVPNGDVVAGGVCPQ